MVFTCHIIHYPSRSQIVSQFTTMHIVTNPNKCETLLDVTIVINIVVVDDDVFN